MGEQTEWTGPQLASWARRVHADLVDAVVPAAMMLGGILTAMLLVRLQEGAAAAAAVGLANLTALAWIVRNLLQQGHSGQTLGKQLTGLRLVGIHSRRPVGPTRSLVRQMLHLVDSVPALVGWLWPLVDRRRQTFADKLAATVVVVVGGSWAGANEAGEPPSPA